MGIIYAMSGCFFMRTVIIMRYVYIVSCGDKTLYTGMTTDIERRVFEHNNSPIWAKYTKARRPVELVWSSDGMTRNEAAREELRIKKMSRMQKIAMI
jgi:putative endonuclease